MKDYILHKDLELVAWSVNGTKSKVQLCRS
jgi:hypothetical protein